MELTDATALATAGGGLIGSHLAGHLRRESGGDVRVTDDFSKGERDWIPEGVDGIEADLTDEAETCEAVTDASTWPSTWRRIPP